MTLSFQYPEALLIGLLLVFLYFRYVRSRNLWRTLMVLTAVLLLAYPMFVNRSADLDVFLVLDRSKSITADGLKRQSEYLDLINDKLLPGDRVSVISFGEKAYVEQALSPGPAVKEMANPFSMDGSDLTDALSTMLTMIDPNRQARALLLSDGEYTSQDPTPRAQLARQQSAPIFIHDLKRANLQNLFIAGIDSEEKLYSNEPFRLIFRVNSTTDVAGRYRILRNGIPAGESAGNGWRNYNFQAGENRIAFTDAVTASGIHGYRIEVETTSATQEVVTADNSAEKFVGILGERPLLVINSDGQTDNLTSVLTAGGIPIHVMAAGNYRFEIEQLAGYKGIILNNVPITGMTKSQIDDISHFVTQEGGGLLVAGGNRSFGAGGYYRTSIDEILPVSLEDRRQNKKLSGAFAFVLDRSGSMAVTVPSGQTKMDLANAAVVEAINLLTASDSISITAVDSAAHFIVPQRPMNDPAGIASQVRKIESMGGGIFVYAGLVAGGNQVINAPQANKHILLFSDAADSEEPGKYKELLEDYTKAGITVSVVGLGTEQDVDAELLKDIAAKGGGNVYFTEDPHQLVQFFTADTIQYTRKNFIEDPAPIKILPGAFMISPEQEWSDFSCADYNLLFPKEGADNAIVTANGDNSPILSFWQRGVGRSAVIALDTGSEFATTTDYPDIILSSARWIMGSDVNDTMQVKSTTRGNYAHISMEVSDEERAAMGSPRLFMYAPDGRTIERPLQWDSWNRLSSDIRLDQTGAWRGMVQVGDKSYRVGPVSMPVSPEFAYRGDVNRGRETLMNLASISGGKELININTLFERSHKSSSSKPLILPLLLLMLLLLLAEIMESRFSWLPRISATFKRGRVGRAVFEAAGRTAQLREKYSRNKSRQTSATPMEKPITVQPEPSKKNRNNPAAPTETMDYLSHAKSRARKSMDKKR